MMNKSNFEFLKGVNDFTYAIACAAENNYPDDPNTTLIKMRMFGEATAKHLGLLLNIPPCENQHDLLRELGKIAFVDDNILSVFHKLRRIGNQAVHEYHNDLDDAQMCLRLGFRLAVWYYRLVTKDYDFPVPVFVLPERGENLYHQEVLTLKQQLEQQVREKAQTQAEVEAQQQKLVALNGYIAILEGKQQETEAQTQARLAALEAQLAEKNAELAKQTEQERKAYHKEITDQAIKRTLNLSEEESRFLIDAQLRKAGWQADSKTLRFSKGARPEPGVNKAIAEWPTGKDETGNQGFADYVLFVGLKPIAVVEAKRKNIDVPGKLNESYRYSKCFDNGFLRETLLEHYSPDEVHEAVPEYEISWQDTSGQQRFKIPFCYSTNGREYRAAMKTKSGIWYRDVRDTRNMSKALPEWHRPEELLEMLGSEPQKQNQWFADNPGMSELGLRYYQEDAVRAVEKAIVKGQQEILLAMATGTGKTRTAIAMMFRLIQSQRFKRILFLVDRRSLGEQALGAFEDTRINGDTFNSIFDIKGLTDKFPEDSTKIHVATVQSLVKRTLQSDEPMPVARYDCIVVDEAHRGYILDKEQTEGELQFRSQLDYVSAYRRILDHFDAVKIALTATPALHTVQIFGEPVYRYTYRTAVIDGFLIDQDPPIFLDIDDEVVSVKSLYGDYDTPQDFLEAFDSLVQRSPNAQPALQAVINRPRDLTRKGLVELQEWFDRQHFEESSLRKAWKETRNEDIAARLIGHIRRAAVGDALKPFEERVDHALTRIKGENDWSSEQLNWLDRLAQALKEKVVLDDDVFKTGNFHRRGGKAMLQRTFDDNLDTLLGKFSDYIWDELA
ncbi:TPA: type I restriction-modification system endonuclease [Escherichia albertii]